MLEIIKQIRLVDNIGKKNHQGEWRFDANNVENRKTDVRKARRRRREVKRAIHFDIDTAVFLFFTE